MKIGTHHPKLIELVIKLVASNWGTTHEEMKLNWKEHAQERSAIAYLLKTTYKQRLKAVREPVGVNSDAPIYQMAKAGAHMKETDAIFRQRLEVIQSEVLAANLEEPEVQPVEAGGSKQKTIRRKKAAKRTCSRKKKATGKDGQPPGEQELKRIAAALCTSDILLSVEPAKMIELAKAVLIYSLWEAASDEPDIIDTLELQLGLGHEEMYTAIGWVSVLIKRKDSTVLKFLKSV